MTTDPLTQDQLEGLVERFPLVDFACCAAFFSDDQPDDGQFLVHGQGRFLGVRMANGVKWFYSTASRPLGRPNARGERPPMKTKAPQGMRHLLVDDPSANELLVVEGEGHGVAVASVGYRGVVIAGGTQALLSNHAEARARRENIFRGKRVRILFDNDEPGRAAASRAAQAILAAGADRVAIVEVNWEPGTDVEDWLGQRATREEALGDLLGLLGGTSWYNPAAEDPENEEVEHVQSTSFRHGTGRYLAVAVWDEAEQQARLAVFGAGGEARTPESHNTVDHDEVRAVGAGWATLERWTMNGTTYVPDLRGDMLKQIENRALIMPAPPEDPGTSEDLWRAVSDFMREWVAVEEPFYNLMTSYVFMTYRLRDAGFEYVPYLRFHGPAGSGKGRALDVMRVLVYRGFATKPTKGNLHRVVDFYGDATLVIDEFNLSRTRSESTEELIDLLNLGNNLSQALPRVQREGRNQEMVIRTFNIFGPKILAGYISDEHEALARRSVTVEMGRVEVPDHMKVFCLPDDFYDRAYHLRARLLGWRGGKLALGQPAHADRHRRLLDVAGHEVGQVFWPLVEMVPASLPGALDDVLNCAVLRQKATVDSRRASAESQVVEAVASLWSRGRAYPLAKENLQLVATKDVAEYLGLQGSGSWREVTTALRGLGFDHRRPRTKNGEQVSGVVLDPEDPAVRRVMERYGIEWPPAEVGGEAGL